MCKGKEKEKLLHKRNTEAIIAEKTKNLKRSINPTAPSTPNRINTKKTIYAFPSSPHLNLIFLHQITTCDWTNCPFLMHKLLAFFLFSFLFLSSSLLLSPSPASTPLYHNFFFIRQHGYLLSWSGHGDSLILFLYTQIIEHIENIKKSSKEKIFPIALVV